MRCALSAVSPMYTCRRINALAALGSHTVQCVLVAYPTDYRGRKFWGPANREEIVSDSVVFCESVFLFRRVSLAGVGSLEADPLSFLAYSLLSFLSSPHHPSPCSFRPRSRFCGSSRNAPPHFSHASCGAYPRSSCGSSLTPSCLSPLLPVCSICPARRGAITFFLVIQLYCLYFTFLLN